MIGNISIPKSRSIESLNDDEITSKVKQKYESMILEDQSIIIMILDNIKPTGTTLTENETTNCTIKFDVLTFYPKLLEILHGEIMQVTGFDGFQKDGLW